MPSSAVRAFSDPDDYGISIRNTTAEMTVTGRGQFAAKIIRIDLHRLWLQRCSDNLPRIVHAAQVGRATVVFRTQPGPSLRWGGAEMLPTNIVRASEGESVFQHSSGSANFAAMSLPVEDMCLLGEEMAGLDLSPPRDAMLISPAPAAMTRLQRLHAAAGDLAENAPEMMANPEVARSLEQALTGALVDCLTHYGMPGDSVAQGQHAIIMRRFRRAVEENPEQPLYIPEICKEIRVPGRTLRMVCQEHLGIGPKRYLLLRRMHLARRALREAEVGTTTVTDVATRLGFWHLSRFAVEYQALFGEPPSATLLRHLD